MIATSNSTSDYLKKLIQKEIDKMPKNKVKVAKSGKELRRERRKYNQ